MNALFTLEIRQSPQTVEDTLVPNNLLEIVSMLGGFLTLITKLISWLIASYQSFAFRKSSIKKLYFYSRTKTKNELKNERTSSQGSTNTIQLTGQSDFNEEIDDKKSHLSFEDKEQDYEKEHQEEQLKKKRSRMEQLVKIMRSKAILSFGYKSYINYYFKMYLFNTFKCFSVIFPCCSCCKYTKHSSMTARKYKRQNNAKIKMSEEFDIIQIVKTLRQVRLLISNHLTHQQRQLVNYLRNYSLETPTIMPEGATKFSRNELMDSLIFGNKDPKIQKVNEYIIDKILMGKQRSLEYIDQDHSQSSSDETFNPFENLSLHHHESILEPEFEEEDIRPSFIQHKLDYAFRPKRSMSHEKIR